MDEKKRAEQIKTDLTADIWGARVPEKPDAGKLAKFIMSLPTIQLLIQKAYRNS